MNYLMKYLMTPKTRAISEAFNTIEAFVGDSDSIL